MVHVHPFANYLEDTHEDSDSFHNTMILHIGADTVVLSLKESTPMTVVVVVAQAIGRIPKMTSLKSFLIK